MAASLSYPSRTGYFSQVAVGTALLAALALWINHSGLDMAIARLFFAPSEGRFPWQHAPVLVDIAYPVVRGAPLAAVLVALGVEWAARRSGRHAQDPVWLARRRTAWTVAGVFVLGYVLVLILKNFTALPRPRHMLEFGGKKPYPTTFWSWPKHAGRALPSGHTAAGFSLLSLYFAGIAWGRGRLRWGGLALAVVVGAGLAWLRIAQGNHFLSETVWSVALMWLVAGLLFAPLIVGAWRPARTGLTFAGNAHSSR